MHEIFQRDGHELFLINSLFPNRDELDFIVPLNVDSIRRYVSVVMCNSVSHNGSLQEHEHPMGTELFHGIDDSDEIIEDSQNFIPDISIFQILHLS